ncbi:glycosyltransferase family 4 protein [Reichenbachiella carrageenanivorans]|uniref:Glycosyltransferase family 4 protein n=1 Tax=Reichenbachiella carrageenanivorans TaxID=2979869 RepID=A0ABY6D0N2_9BACT|nr:glycosyltransferase family 4 protein [Reichenbachiella carrageenanivorans]UXX79735.1 glycosyltransferase family 4 protein [Reichenbachiella carrageenanivorans]
MNTKLLILGPGAPSRETSGLGKATAHLVTELSKKNDLTLVEPRQLGELATHTNAQRNTTAFSDLSILQELATVSIEAQLSAYHYQEISHTKTMEKVESKKLHNQLTAFTEELVLAGKKIDFDLLYAHDWITFKAALELKEKFGKPLLLHVHSLDYDRNFGKEKSWIFDLEKKAMETAEAVIAISAYSKKIMIEQYGIYADKIHVIYHGHSHQKRTKINNPFTEKVVLFVGRLSGQKGPMQFLKIAEKVYEKYPDSRFVMAGDGDLYKKLIVAGAGSEIAGRFHITGHLDQTELQKLYAIANVYCMPSFSEPFGLTALEAAEAKVPLVLSKNCGAAELLTEAKLATPGDSDDFADAILEILENPTIAEAQVKANKKSIEKLNWGQSADEVLAVAESIL